MTSPAENQVDKSEPLKVKSRSYFPSPSAFLKSSPVATVGKSKLPLATVKFAKERLVGSLAGFRLKNKSPTFSLFVRFGADSVRRTVPGATSSKRAFK